MTKINLELRSKVGDWAFVRYLRNSRVSFPTAYYVMFGRSPKKV